MTPTHQIAPPPPEPDDSAPGDAAIPAKGKGSDAPRSRRAEGLKPLPRIGGGAPSQGLGFAGGRIALNRSPLARKIIVFNLLGLIVLVFGVLYMHPFRDSLVLQRERGLVAEARLVADVFEASVSDTTHEALAPEAAQRLLGRLTLPSGTDVIVFDPDERVLAATQGQERRAPPPIAALERDGRSTVITDFLNRMWEKLAHLTQQRTDDPDRDAMGLALGLFPAALTGAPQIVTERDAAGATIFAVAMPIRRGDAVIGVVAVTSAAGEIDDLIRAERELVLQMFVIALLVSIGLSLVLASTIATPLSDLASAAERGRDRNSRRMGPGRIRIPDFAGRKDEIGRLANAMRSMVAALYDRIDANEQFAADVAHEIKNPLASLRSAVGTLRLAKREDQRERLLSVIEHDVRRLDRLVSDISNASRLDSELVKEEEQRFDLLTTLSGLANFLAMQAAEKGVELVCDLPEEPIVIQGLEARLAQVFVNLISNAISFCEDGDAVRLWARRRDNRVLVVVEDTGPGIPEEALTKVFRRFYSERPPGQFGNHSGLGLAISRQIVEAHGGVIWAENIRPTEADPTSDPLGARFVVGLPL